MPRKQYLFLAEKLANQIKSGEIAGGTRLPTHRAFAEANGVALATATRAYEYLRQQGLIVGEAGRGMFVRNSELPVTLGIEQFEKTPIIDMIFNMPSDPDDSEFLRSGLLWLAHHGDLNSLMCYQPHAGAFVDRKVIASHISKRLGPIDPESLFITSGAQHGLAVVAFSLLRRGDTVAVDHLTYPGFKEVVRMRDLTLVPVTDQSDPMCPTELDKLCAYSPVRAVYLLPTVHNPLGSVMDESTRRAIVDVARHRDLLIFEDGAYDFLEINPPPSFLELAPERAVYIGGFSKIVATGLRVGHIVVPNDMSKNVSMAIRATTWNTPALLTALMSHLIENDAISHFEKIRRDTGARRQQLCRALLEKHEMRAHQNASFVWLPLPQLKRAEPIISELYDAGIGVSSADPYAVHPYRPQALRLAFGGIDDEELRLCLMQIRAALESA